MGVVYWATDLALDRPVALKLIANAHAGDATFRKRFTTESRTAASLDHPNVVPIFHAGEHDGALYLAMRYVEGKDLATEIRESGRLEADRAVRIVAQVASALGAAHDNGLVHRDVKPANVLLTPEDHAYLSDFGLTKRARGDSQETQTGHLVGTLNYVAPEQIRGESVGPRSDIYALGCVLFHALTGQPPFPMESDEAKLWAHLSEPAPSVTSVSGDVDPEFDPVIARAMAKEPAERFGTAMGLAEAALEVVPADSPAAESKTESKERRGRLVYALLDTFNVVLLALLLIAGVLLGELLLTLPFAVAIYGVAVARTYLDPDVKRRFGERAHRAAVADSEPRIAELLKQAEAKEAKVRQAIEGAGLTSNELSGEVDRYIDTIRRTAAGAELLQENLDEAPPEAIAGRLGELRRAGDPGKAKLIEALEEQLAAQVRMDGQLRRFFDQMEQTLVQLDTMRAKLITSTASARTQDGDTLAAEVRGMRGEMGDVADDLAAARPG